MATLTLVDTTSTQTLAGKTLTSPTITSGTISLAAAPVNTLDAATKGYVDGLNTTPILNGSLTASVASNILTLSLQTAGGSTPSANNPVRCTFRSGTATDGSLITRTVSNTVSMTFASGSTLGTQNNTAARIWVGLIDNAGTVELCAWNSFVSTLGAGANTVSLKAYVPNTYVSTTAEGSGTATSAGILYSTNARTTVPFILLGYIEIIEVTAGVWASAPSIVLTYRDGMKKTGDLVQHQYAQTGVLATGTTTIPNTNAVPQNTQGDQYMSLAITPLSALNWMDVEAKAHIFGSATTDSHVTALFQDSNANALQTVQSFLGITGTTQEESPVIYWSSRTGTTSTTTFKVRAGGTSGTITFNGNGGVATMGGTLNSYISIKEWFV